MKYFSLAACCGALLSIFMVTSAFAIEQAQAAGPIEHVLVSVPLHRSEAETALPVTVLVGDELRNKAANSLGETLEKTPGISSASFGPGVGQPVIRGQQGARVMVLQNSTGSADASNSSGDHAVSVEPVLAESIEVMRGPATLLYGGGAIGGVVNVIDNRVPVAVPNQTNGVLELRHSSVNDETAGVFLIEAGADNVALHLDATARDSNNLRIPGHAVLHGDSSAGYIENSDGEAQTVTAGGSVLFDRGFIGIAVNDLNNEYGIPPGAHDHDSSGEEEPVRIDIDQLRVDLRGDYHFDQEALEAVRWFLTYSDYQHKELEGGDVGTRWSNDSWESRIEVLHRPVAGWHGVVGLQLTDFELAAVGEESFIPRTDVSRFGLFIVEDYHWQDWLFELGARWDHDQLHPDNVNGERFNNISLANSALWQFHRNWSLGVALSHAARAPVIEELYSNQGNTPGSYVEHVASGSVELGDAGLGSERANNLDLTLSYKSAKVDSYLTLFYNDFQDFIYLANTGAQQGSIDVLAYTQADAYFAGAEVELDYEIGQLAGGVLSVGLFGDWVTGQLDSGEDLPRLPPMRIGSRISYLLGNVGSFIAVTHASEQDKPGTYEQSTAGYTRWDAGADYTIALAGEKELLVFIKLDNLTDEDIRYSTSLLREVAPEAGRSVRTGLRLSF